jgi:hypothetical protein
MHPNTQPETIVDKNGVTTTRHKKSTATTATRKLPTPTKIKAVTGAERIAGSSTLEKLNFDISTLLVQDIVPGAKTVTVDNDDDQLVLTAIDGAEVPDGISGFLASRLLNQAGISEGTYKLSSAVNEDKTKSLFNAEVLHSNGLSKESLTENGLTEMQAIAAIGFARTETDAYALGELAGYTTNPLVLVGVVMNSNTSEGTLADLADDPSSLVRSAVADKTKDPEVVSKLTKDTHSVLVVMNAVRNSLASSDDLDAAYRNSSSEMVRNQAVGNDNALQSTLSDAINNDWDSRVIDTASSKLTSGEASKWTNTIPKAFIKDNELQSAARAASDYVKTVSGSDYTKEHPEAILTDEQARAIAWRVASRNTNGDNEAFTALDAGDDFSLQKLVVEAANIKNQRFSDRSYGLKWDVDAYMPAIIGWARTKQGRAPRNA